MGLERKPLIQSKSTFPTPLPGARRRLTGGGSLAPGERAVGYIQARRMARRWCRLVAVNGALQMVQGSTRSLGKRSNGNASSAIERPLATQTEFLEGSEAETASLVGLTKRPTAGGRVERMQVIVAKSWPGSSREKLQKPGSRGAKLPAQFLRGR